VEPLVDAALDEVEQSEIDSLPKLGIVLAEHQAVLDPLEVGAHRRDLSGPLPGGVELEHVTMLLASALIWGPILLIAGVATFAVSDGIPQLWKWYRCRALPIPITGQEELERCREALVEYMSIDEEKLGRATAAGSVKLYPYLAEACRVLDDQNIPHPTIDYTGVYLSGVKKWTVFLGDLWAVRHDLERARRVYQEDS